MIEGLLPRCLMIGISYGDFWSMTLGEILAVVKYSDKREEQACRDALITAGYGAYHAAAFSRCRASAFPHTLAKAFPALFGRTADGQIKADGEHEEEVKAGFMRMAAKNPAFKITYKKEAGSNG